MSRADQGLVGIGISLVLIAAGSSHSIWLLVTGLAGCLVSVYVILSNG